MERIWKYPLEIEDRHDYVMPAKSEILHVGEQNEKLYVWIRSIEDAPRTKRRIVIYGTGHQIHNDNEKYVGTVIMSYGLVWHVYDAGEIN